MLDLALARVLHVLTVVLWIGGVAMVTLVILPRVRGSSGTYETFEAFERRFALHSRVMVPLAGLSGFYLVWRLDLWARFAEPRFWWMHAMAAIWTLFMLVLFVLEPALGQWLRRRAKADPGRVLRQLQRLHELLLAASLVTLAGAVAGAHGAF